MRLSIVLGLGFGDEGKGITVSRLCSETDPKNTIVIRFSGGPQAGHTVVHLGHRHVFSNFGSGTLQGVPSYWSRFCLFNPENAQLEWQALQQFKPVLYVDPLCLVVTPYDVMANRCNIDNIQHGTCGMGIGSTHQRIAEHYNLFAQDLLFPRVYNRKLKLLAENHKEMRRIMPSNEAMIGFLEAVENIKSFAKIERPRLHDGMHMVFEGSQGILLDQDFGFYPHVTRSHTTSRNVYQLLKEWHFKYNALHRHQVHYVHRVYQTRHGNGPMSNEMYNSELQLANNEQETNVKDKYQGNFRVAPLDLDLIRYAAMCDANFESDAKRTHLVFTCLDQVDRNDIPYTKGDQFLRGSIEGIIEHLSYDFHHLIAYSQPENQVSYSGV